MCYKRDPSFTFYLQVINLFQEWSVDFYDQLSSQSSGGGFSVNEAATPSPSPLTPTSTPTLLQNYEQKVRSVSPAVITAETANILESPFKYFDIIQNQPSPVKLVPMNEEVVTELNFLDYYSSPGVSPLKGLPVEKQFTKTRKLGDNHCD